MSGQIQAPRRGRSSGERGKARIKRSPHAPRRAVAPIGERVDEGRYGRHAREENASASHLKVLSRLVERIRGLKGTDGKGYAVLVPCRDIHTFGMEGPIDAAFVDAAGTVVAVHRRIMPGRRIRHADARLVVERLAQPGAWLERGDDVFNVSPEGMRRHGERGEQTIKK